MPWSSAFEQDQPLYVQDDADEQGGMLVNQKVAVVGPRVVLVPYRPEHVPTYNEWMQSEELRELTASEPLTLEEEYAMCDSWATDADKLTFIVLERDRSVPLDPIEGFRKAHGVERMIGDVNLFLTPASPPPSPSPSSGPSASSEPTKTTSPSQKAELELMIASSAHRSRGFGTEALQHFVSYASKELGLSKDDFVVRIGMDNVKSLKLFERLGFEKYKEVSVFNEVELRWPPDVSLATTEWPWEVQESWKTVTAEWP